MVQYGQLIIGPPGSGKSTYCHKMGEYLKSVKRNVALVNLDFGNDMLPYEADINVTDLISIEDAMEVENLGPNGAILFCFEHLLNNIEWLITELKRFPNCEFIMDCPGQIELYTHDEIVQKITQHIALQGIRLAVVYIADSTHCKEATTFISILLETLISMLHMPLPRVNVLSKVDILDATVELPLSLDYYTEVMDLNYIMETISDHPFFAEYKYFNKNICEMIEDYALVNFSSLDISKEDNFKDIIVKVDAANGCLFGNDSKTDTRFQSYTAPLSK